ncbi:MAG: RNA polymerase sigma factor [Candidatus Zixiibacteriota bacterium]
MDIDGLYKCALEAREQYEEQLFKQLSVRYHLFAEHKIRSIQDREEVVQRAIVVVVNKYREIDIHTSFSAWAHKVLHNEILRHYSSKAKGQKMMNHSILEFETVDKNEPNLDLRRTLRNCMKQLCIKNQRYARILNLKYQGYSTHEICEKLDISESNFYVVLFRARSILKHCLEKGNIDYE